DRSVGTSELLQNAASGGNRERGERVIEAGLAILNHSVQYTQDGAAVKGGPPAGYVSDRTRPRGLVCLLGNNRRADRARRSPEKSPEQPPWRIWPSAQVLDLKWLWGRESNPQPSG